MSGHGAENDARCDGCGKRPCVCETVVLPSAEDDAHQSGNDAGPCPECGSGETHVSYEDICSNYCRDCRHYWPVDWDALSRPIPPGRVEP